MDIALAVYAIVGVVIAGGIPVVYGFRVKLGEDLDGQDFAMNGLGLACLWPIALSLWITVGFGKLLASVFAESAPAASLKQPDLGPHRTPRCGACGKSFGDRAA